MNTNANASGDANPSDAVPGDHSAATQTPRDAVVDEPTLSSDASRSNTARQQRARRRMTRYRKAPSWVRKISWILFPIYGFMRLHDENYEQHSEQWREQ